MKGRKRITIFICAVWLSAAGNYGLAYDNVHLIEDAGAGDREAQYTLAHLYSKGLGGVERNIMRAVSWFRRSAEAGHVDSMYDLAMILHDGELANTNTDESFYWLKKSADMGHADAQYALGRAYGASDPEKGVYWLKQAVINGHREASDYLDTWCKGESLTCD